MLIDRFQREITYLRISVTDRCNFRCVYCMPAEGIPRVNHQDILSYEEITKFVRLAVSEGIRRVRVTGGEPLVRRNLVSLIQGLAEIQGLEEISLTTNGFLLDALATSLAHAGLTRVNISLDTLEKDKFKAITRGGSFDQVWKGILAAEKAGLTPIKLNAVVVRGLNDSELLDMARLTLEHPWQMRFIELMPVGNQQDWGTGFPVHNRRYFSTQEMLQTLEPLKLEPLEQNLSDGPAREFRIPGAAGILGFISPIGDHFCGTCNRLRLTADGRLRPCLLIDREISIREALRSEADLIPFLYQAIDLKPEGHEMDHLVLPQIRKMAEIGG